MTENINTPETTEVPEVDSSALKALQKIVPNGGRVFVTEKGASDGGIVSFQVYAGRVTRAGHILMEDVTEALKAIPGADGKFRGRPRKDAVLRAAGDDKNRPAKVLGRQIATALHGEGGKVTVQEL